MSNQTHHDPALADGGDSAGGCALMKTYYLPRMTARADFTCTGCNLFRITVLWLTTISRGNSAPSHLVHVGHFLFSTDGLADVILGPRCMPSL